MQQIVRVPLYKELIMKSVRLFSLFVSIAFVHGLLGMEVEENNKLIRLGNGRISTHMSKRSGQVVGDLSPGGMKTIADCFPEELQVKIARDLIKNHPVMSTILQKIEVPEKKLAIRDAYFERYSPDFSKAITATFEGEEIIEAFEGVVNVQIRNIETGELLHTLPGYTRLVDLVSWSNDGSKVIVRSCDHTAKIWNADTGECLPVLEGNNNIVRVIWSSDSSKLLTELLDNTVKIWNVDTGECLRVLEGHNRVILGLWSCDSSKVFFMRTNKIATIWDSATGALLTFPIEVHIEDIVIAKWADDDSKVLVGPPDGAKEVRDADTGQYLGMAKLTSTVLFDSVDGEILIDGKIARVLDGTGACLHTLVGHTGLIYHAQLNPDNTTVITGSYDKTAKIWDVSTGECLYTLTGYTGGVSLLAWSSDGSKVLTGFNNVSKIFDVSKLVDVQKFLNKSLDFKQALLLDVIDKEAIAKEKIIILSHGETELFHTLSPEVKDALGSYVTLRSHTIR